MLPSDHLIVDDNKLLQTIEAANDFVEKNEDYIVTFGMQPNRPETGYGYIKSGETKEKINGFEIKKVDKFVEKPNKEKAESYLRAGNFLWNGGMFIWKCSTIFKLTEKYLNKTYNILKEIAGSKDEEFNDMLKKEYVNVDDISVDYGIMEKADNIYVIPCDFGWDDIGTWYAVERYRDKDVDNNVCVGEVKSIDSKNSILVGKEKPIVVVGLSDVFVVESDDIIFVGKKEDIERIKEIKKKVVK